MSYNSYPLFIIFTRTFQVQVILFVIAVLMNLFTGFHDSTINQFASSFGEMCILSGCMILRNFKANYKLLNRLTVFLICIVGSVHFMYYIENVLKLSHPAILDRYFSLKNEIVSFVVFVFAVYCLLNIVLIINNKTLGKLTMIMLDYGYLAFGFIALMFKYTAKYTTIEDSLNITTFIIGAIAIALRFTKTNADFVLNYKIKRVDEKNVS